VCVYAHYEVSTGSYISRCCDDAATTIRETKVYDANNS